MAKNDKAIMYGIIGATAIIIVYLLVKNSKSTSLIRGISPTGCYPLEEVHPADADNGTMWMSIIKYDNNGSMIRPQAGTFSIGDQITLSNTGSALDETYTILYVWIDDDNNIGSFEVDKPPTYTYNYNATQGNNVVDMTFFGEGTICKI
tara:strand:+ start:1957 stop:2403 length:447 start_codon:yes stop_codon:yes gene_type:complete